MEGYNPIFKGELPDGAVARWQSIRAFYNQWSRPEGNPLKESLDEDSELISSVKAYGVQSPAILQWFIFIQQGLETDTPYVRDGPVFKPIESFFDHPEARNAMVILEAGESDFFWGVDVSDLNKDDPPVRVYSNFDMEDQVVLGSIESVSEFALIYMAAYNSFADFNCVEWFQANGTEAEIRRASEWFDFCLDVPKGPMFDGVGILESENAAAFAIGQTMYVSLFCEPAELKLPAFLLSALKAHRKIKAEYQAR